jgi:RNA polymerase sigma-70 factor (ECF subfamily)
MRPFYRFEIRTILTEDRDKMDLPPAPSSTSLQEAAFRVELEALIPQLRAFARSLCGQRDLADDLAQEALLKAWAARDKFQIGTNLRAWVFIILRNVFLSQMRRARFKGDWNQEAAERILAAPARQVQQLQMSDLQRALMRLPDAQREALILVGAGGLAYEEVAEICGCAVGTVKSRVARARVALERIFADGTCPPRSSCDTAAAAASEAILDEVDRITGK